MTNRDNMMWTLWWTSDDGQACMWGGNYATRDEAVAALPAVEAECIEQCMDDEQLAAQRAGRWDIQMPDELAEAEGLRYRDTYERL